VTLSADPITLASLLGAAVVLLVLARLARRMSRRTQALLVPSSLRDLSPDEFERRLGRAMQREGYSIVGTDPHSMTLRRSGEITLIWFSGWRETPLSFSRLRRLQALLVERGAAGCKVLTVFAQSDALRKRLVGKAISILDARDIAVLMGVEDQERLNTTFNASFVPDGAHPAEVSAPMPQPPTDGSPACPRCKAPMTLQTAGVGGALGQHFWKCSRAPECRGIRPAN
jgi:restriction system protein